MPQAPSVNPGVARRLDLLALRKPQTVKRGMWFEGILGLWAAIGTVSSLAVQHWGIAAITCATSVVTGFMWWASRRSLRRVPETARWLDAQSG